MSDTRTWLPLFPRDFLADTGHLTAEQTGAYLLLLMRSWMAGPLPTDDGQLARICRVSVLVWNRRIKPTVLQFFDIDGATMTQKRLEKERARASKNQDAKKISANARWRKNLTSPDATAYAPDMRTASPPPPPPERKKESTTVPPQQRPSARAQAALAFGVPDWIPKDAWEAFMEVRRHNRAKQTDAALNAIVAALAKFRQAGHSIDEILWSSVRSSWSGVFPPKGPRLAVSNSAPKRAPTASENRWGYLADDPPPPRSETDYGAPVIDGEVLERGFGA